ncbi:MAG TPA: sigma-70 factor domain-containing protein, partial [Gaiellaceae bacterium]|nr:sigma-70 factor domain-containing protein [Gaiellaceae bacterium]
MAVETEILRLSEELRQLVEGSEERGSLLQSELNEVLEPLQLDPLEADQLFRELETRQIDVVDDSELPPAPRPREPAPPALESTTDALQLFLREAGRHPLLTAAQEVELAKKIERGDPAA